MLASDGYVPANGRFESFVERVCNYNSYGLNLPSVNLPWRLNYEFENKLERCRRKSL